MRSTKKRTLFVLLAVGPTLLASTCATQMREALIGVGVAFVSGLATDALNTAVGGADTASGTTTTP
ncbi:MAG: hypothetical protein ACE5E6_08590 [Phycisphaerae bacterium]